MTARNEQSNITMTPYPFFTVPFTVMVIRNEARTSTPVKVQTNAKVKVKKPRRKRPTEGGERSRVKRDLKAWRGTSEAERIISRGNNLWYQWAQYTAQTVRPGKDCYICSMAQEEKVVIPVPWRSEDCPEHYWDYKNHDVKPHCPFQCMIYLGSLIHRQRVQIWSKTM